MPPYNLKHALTKIHDKPFNFQLIMGKKQVLLVTPKPAAKTQVDEAIATAIKGVREAKGICKRVGEEIIFFTKNAPTGMLRTGMKLAFNTNNCKSVAWDLQQLKPGESEEVHTEVVEQDNEPEADSDTTSGSEEIPEPTTTTPPPQRPTTPWIGVKRSQPSTPPPSNNPPNTPPPQPPKSSTPPPRPNTPPPGVTPKPPQPTTNNPQQQGTRPLPPTPQPKVSNTPPPRPTTPPPGVTPKVSGNVPNADARVQKEAFEKGYRDAVSLYHNGDEEIRKLYADAGQLAGKHDFVKANEALEKLKNVAANKQQFAQAKTAKQAQRHGRLNEVVGSVQRSYFNAGMAKNIGKEDLKAGKDFKAFLEALKVVEEAKAKPNRAGLNQALDELEAKANAYLQHYYSADLNDKQRKQKESMRKRSICETTLKSISHWRLVEQITNLGAPPWDSQKEQKAAEVYSKLLFEEGDKTASLNESAGVSGSWWVEKTVWGDKADDTQQKRKFIFKPMDAEGEILGFPKGGSAPREVLGKAFSDVVLSSTGIDLGVAETQLVSVDNNMLPDREGNADQEKPGQRIGSLQHFAKSGGKIEGELQDVALKKNPNIYNEIPKEEVQKIALMDLMSLNMDRHGGNIILSEKTDENGKKVPTLIPIDHGLILPSRKGLDERRTKMGKTHNTLEKIPAKNEKFSPEILQKLQLLDPDMVVNAMKASLQTMKDGHPGQNFDELIPAENLKLQKRAIQFLKQAAPELTVTELFNAMVADLELIFDTPDNQMEVGFDKAIAAAKERGAARREMEEMDDDALNKMTDEIHALGWCPQLNERSFSMRGWDLWLDVYGVQALKIWKGKIENPETRKEIDKLVAELGGPDKVGFTIEGGSLRETLKKLQDEVAKRAGLSPEAQAQKDQRLTAMAKTLGAEKVTRVELVAMEAFEAAGGTAQLATSPEYKNLTFPKKVELFWRKQIEPLGGDNLLKEIQKACPAESNLAYSRKTFETVKAWPEYQRLGGNAKYFALVGDGDIGSVTERLRALRHALSQEIAFKAL